MVENYASEINKVVEKVNQIPDKKFSFVYATDLHVDFKENQKVVWPQCEAMVEIANRANVDCVVLVVRKTLLPICVNILQYLIMQRFPHM